MSAQEEVLRFMQTMTAKYATRGVALQLPPASNQTLGIQYTHVEMGKSLRAEVKFDRRFTNPLGMFQGGFIGAVIDEVFGPLTYMAAERPAVAIEMNASYVRPFTEKDGTLVVHAEVVSKSNSLLLLRAEARTASGKLVATATNRSFILADAHLA